MTLDLRLYLVTDPSYDDLDAIVAAAVAGGVTCVQVRDKNGTSAQREAAVARLRTGLPPSVAVLVNDDLAAARAGDGLHVGVSDTDPVTARALLGPDAVIGWSVNDVAQLEDAEQLAACDYVAASPVWSTPTKTDTTAPFGLDGVRELAALLGGRLPLVAIGGIDRDNVADVVAAGADGIAVVSAICAAEDPSSAAAGLLRAVDQGLATRGGAS